MAEPTPARPSLMTRLAAALRGEVGAQTVEAYRRAGRQAYEDLLTADTCREQLALNGTDLWSAPPGTGSQLLATWNAFALQTLGEAFIDADYQADPRTVGYLPPVTAEQAARFLGEVEHWSSTARRAAADPAFALDQMDILPAPLPAWVETEPCPQPHLHAMLAAGRALRDKVEHAFGDFERAGVPFARETEAAQLHGLFADASSALDYAIGLADGAAPGLHERIERSVKRAVAGFYRLGQILAVPALLERADVRAEAVGAGRGGALPGQPGFDPWCLTDPATRASWQRDPKARAAIDSLWRYDPDPGRTLDVHAQIEAAVAAGALTQGATADGRQLGSYYCCPWSAVYTVRQAVVLEGQRFRALEQVTFDVSAEEVLEGGAFTRRLLRGPFSPSSRVDYCDPSLGGHHDDD